MQEEQRKARLCMYVGMMGMLVLSCQIDACGLSGVVHRGTGRALSGGLLSVLRRWDFCPHAPLRSAVSYKLAKPIPKIDEQTAGGILKVGLSYPQGGSPGLPWPLRTAHLKSTKFCIVRCMGVGVVISRGNQKKGPPALPLPCLRSLRAMVGLWAPATSPWARQLASSARFHSSSDLPER